MATVVLAGTLDTKGTEYGYVRDRLQAAGASVVLVDTGVLGAPAIAPDIGREEVARAGGGELEALVAQGDRGQAIEVMAAGLSAIVRQLYADGQLHALFGLGGTGGSSILSAAMRTLPVGVPKLMVSTVASGDTRPYVGTGDVTMMHSVVDIAGVNQISEPILANAAAAAAAMAAAHAEFQATAQSKPIVGATMFGVTTPCITVARERLEALGYEVLVFHATGTGGQSMERLIRDGFITGALDATTTELADDIAGGVFSAGPDRLSAAAALGIPQVVSVGALDMVNFGPIDTVPEKYRGRLLYKHNPTITLMRTTPEECAAIGTRLATQLNAAGGPVILFLPLRGISLIATDGQVFHDPAADAALFTAIREHLADHVEIRELELDINDPEFALAMANELDRLHRAWLANRNEVLA